MKTPLILILIFCTWTICAQTDTTKFKSKEEKFEIILNHNLFNQFKSTSFHNSHYLITTFPFGNPIEVNEPVEYYRDRFKINNKFDFIYNVELGISNSFKLCKFLELSVGANIGYLEFKYSQEKDSTRIQTGSGIVLSVNSKNEPLEIHENIWNNEGKQYSDFMYLTKVASISKFISINLPISFIIKPFKKISTSVGVSFNVPIWSQINLIDHYQKEYIFLSENTSLISLNKSNLFFNNINYIGFIDLKYRTSKHIHFSIKYNLGFNSILRDLRNTDYETAFGNVNKVNIQGLGFGIGYNIN